MPHLFVNGDEKLRPISRCQPFRLHDLQKGHQAGHAPLVVDEPGLQETGRRHHRFRVKEKIVTDLDSQRPYLLRSLHLFVDADRHVVLIPGTGDAVRENMNSRAEA